VSPIGGAGSGSGEEELEGGLDRIRSLGSRNDRKGAAEEVGLPSLPSPLPEGPRSLPPDGREEGVHLEGEDDDREGDYVPRLLEGVELPVPIEVRLVGVLGPLSEGVEGSGPVRLG